MRFKAWLIYITKNTPDKIHTSVLIGTIFFPFLSIRAAVNVNSAHVPISCSIVFTQSNDNDVKSRKLTMVRTCKFPGCDHKNVPGSPFRFHRFPVSDIAMRQLWLVAIGYSAGAKISRIKDFRVCSAHFSEDDYIPNQGGKRKKQILKSFAVPVPRVSSIY